MIRGFLFLVLAQLLLFLNFAGTSTGQKVLDQKAKSLMDEFFEATRLEQSIQNISDTFIHQTSTSVRAQFKTRIDQQTDPDARKKLEVNLDQMEELFIEAVTKAYSVDQIRKFLLEAFKPRWNEKLAQDIIQSSQEELVERIFDEYLAASSPEGIMAFQKYARGIGANPPSKTRIELLSHLLTITNEVEQVLELQASMAIDITLEMGKAMGSKEKPPTVEQVHEFKQNIRNRLRPVMAEQSLLMQLYVFQNFNQEEVKQYIKIIQTDAYTWYYEASFETVRYALTECAAIFARLVGEGLNDIHSSDENPEVDESLSPFEDGEQQDDDREVWGD